MPLDFSLLNAPQIDVMGSYQRGIGMSQQNAQNQMQQMEFIQQAQRKNRLSDLLKSSGDDLQSLVPKLAQGGFLPEAAAVQQMIPKREKTPDWQQPAYWEAQRKQKEFEAGLKPEKQEGTLAKIDPKDYTPQSVKVWFQGGMKDPSMLVARSVAPKESEKIKLQFNEGQGGFIEPPSAQFPQGRIIPVPGYVKKADAQSPQGKAEIDKNSSIEGARRALDTVGYDPATGRDRISDLIKQSTSSGIGSVVDWAGDVVGSSTAGADAISAIEAISKQITLDRLNGKLGAGISNADVMMLDKALGDIANPRKSADRKLAAWGEAKRVLEQSAGYKAVGQIGATGGWGRQQDIHSQADAILNRR